MSARETFSKNCLILFIKYRGSSALIHLLVILLVLPARDIVEPFLIVEIPLHGLLDALFELEGRLPAEFALELGGVDGVAGVVAEAVGDEGDEVEVSAFRSAELAVNRLYDGLDDVDVLPLVETADVVSLCDSPLTENQVDGPRVILHIEPVADILALAIDRERLAVADIVDEQRDKLLRELVRAVVVGAVRHYGRHPVSVVERADEVVAARLGGGIRRVRVVFRGLVEEVLAVRQEQAIMPES